MTATALRAGRDSVAADAVAPARAPDCAATALPALAALIEGLPDPVWLVDAAGLRVLAANAAAGRMLGVPAQALCGRSMAEMSSTPQDLCFWTEVAAGLSEGIVSETLLTRADGSLLPVMRSACRVVLGDGAPTVYVVALHDRSAERDAEEAREALLAGLQATLESTADGILVTDLAGRISACNQRFAALWDIDDALLARRDDAALRDWMQNCVAEPQAYAERLAAIDGSPQTQTSDVLRLRSGRVLERVTLPQRSRGRTIGRVCSFRDISDKLAADRRIEQLSHTDALTGLPNRRLLTDRAELALAMADRDGTPFAVLFLDLDRFKHINDSLGHLFGDRVLVDVAGRIQGCLRPIDTVARLGGDEFVILLHQADAAGAEASAQRVIESLSRPFVLDGLNFTVTCSIGIALHPQDGATMDELLRHADKAMYRVKDGGRAGYRFHQPHKGVDLRGRMRIDHAMRQALADGRFRLHYQPQVCLASGRVVGAEALLRWTDPELGEMAPAEFIPVAEESGFIVAMGDWVLGEAVARAARWHASGLRIVTAVNVSALQFHKPDFVERVAQVLRRTGLPPGQLDLELTETILLQDAREALTRVEALAHLGVLLSIDDFGTGYSSLAYLKRVPIHQLKIDRSFVDGLPASESDVGIVRAIIDMGRALRLQVIAEGVETEAQRQFLQRAGCNRFQGFLCAPALAAPEFERLAIARAPRAMRLVNG